MKLRAGQTLVSAVDSTSVVVTRAPDDDVALTCGGVVMVAAGEPVPPAEPDADLQAGTLLGKRYVDAAGALEVLCTKAGSGTLALDGEALAVQGARPLPSSD